MLISLQPVKFRSEHGWMKLKFVLGKRCLCGKYWVFVEIAIWVFVVMKSKSFELEKSEFNFIYTNENCVVLLQIHKCQIIFVQLKAYFHFFYIIFQVNISVDFMNVQAVYHSIS